MQKVTEFTLDPRALEKWMRQNDAELIDAIDGCLLDNMLFCTRRGHAAVFEKYVNPNMSTYYVIFQAGRADDVFTVWYEHADAAAAAE